MALSPIMLTAWAVSELPQLQIDGYRDSSTAELDRVTCRTTDGSIVSIASPNSATAAAQQDREHRIGQLLSSGVRERLGFDVPHTLGAGLLGKRRVVISKDVPGQPLASIRDIRPMLPSLGLALAHLHAVPTTIVKSDSIPTKTSLDCLREAAGIIDRAHQTTRVPSALLDRWDAAIEDTELWQFTPSIVHGNLEFESIITAGDDVIGITNWADAGVGDPAVDLKCVVGPFAPEVSAGFVTDYIAHRGNNDSRVGHRSRFLSELDIARWLVHGVDTDDDAIVAEAVAMLNALAASVADNPAATLGAAPFKPVNLLVDSADVAVPAVAAANVFADAPTEAVVEPVVEAFVDDAPTMVAPEPAVVLPVTSTDVVDEPVAPAESPIDEPTFEEPTFDEPTFDELEFASEAPVGTESTLVVETGSIEAAVVEAFFSENESPAKPADDEIL